MRRKAEVNRMLELHLSQDDLERRSLGEQELQRALHALRQDGFVVLHNAISLEHIESLRQRMLADGQRLHRTLAEFVLAMR